MAERGKKGELIWDEFIPWIIGIGILVLVFILYGVISGKLAGMLQAFKDLLRIGR